MRGYKISSLSVKTQELIKNEGIDINNDKLINEDNGELANSLSRTGKSNINELCYDSWFGAKKMDFVVGGIMALGGAHALTGAYFLRPNVTLADIKDEAKTAFLRHNGGFWEKKNSQLKLKVSMKECLKEGLKKCKRSAVAKAPISGLYGIVGLFGLGIAAYLFTRKPGGGIAKWIGCDDYTPVERQRSEYEDQYREVFGEDSELKEYVPQKGEYWISILKAKYGVDDVTAQKMAHRIKDVIYEDSLAAKQSPVMYLPQTWTFEGKTYQYNDSVKVDKIDSYSADVKTEMGKMDKDVKYDKKE